MNNDFTNGERDFIREAIVKPGLMQDFERLVEILQRIRDSGMLFRSEIVQVVDAVWAEEILEKDE